LIMLNIYKTVVNLFMNSRLKILRMFLFINFAVQYTNKKVEEFPKSPILNVLFWVYSDNHNVLLKLLAKNVVEDSYIKSNSFFNTSKFLGIK
jgi:hypothetical protein